MYSNDAIGGYKMSSDEIIKSMMDYCDGCPMEYACREYCGAAETYRYYLGVEENADEKD